MVEATGDGITKDGIVVRAPFIERDGLAGSDPLYAQGVINVSRANCCV